MNFIFTPDEYLNKKPTCFAIPGKLPSSFNSKNGLSHTDTLNLVAKVGKYVDMCAGSGRSQNQIAYLWNKSDEWFLTSKAPEGGELLKILPKKIGHCISEKSYFKL